MSICQFFCLAIKKEWVILRILCQNGKNTCKETLSANVILSHCNKYINEDIIRDKGLTNKIFFSHPPPPLTHFLLVTLQNKFHTTIMSIKYSNLLQFQIALYTKFR